MRKTVLYTAVSIDGYVAAEGDDLSWLEAAEDTSDVDEDYIAFERNVTTVVMGNGTYRYIVKEGVLDPYPDRETYVFTRTEGQTSPHVTYVTEDPSEFTRKLKQGTGGDIWIVGGGNINGQLLAADLIDELQLSIAPITLGSGARLFEGRSDWREFELMDTKPLGVGLVKLTYTRKPTQ